MNQRIIYTKLPPQCIMLEVVPPRRSKMFLKWQDLQKRELSSGLNPKPNERLHIWQKAERLREENILEDYYWFYEEWDRINKMFMKRFFKTFPKLLMERIHHHRIKMENSIFLASCILALAEDEDNSNDPTKWEKTLRQYPWFSTLGIPRKPQWKDGKASIPKHPKKDQSLERIGRADRDNLKFEYFKDRWAYLKKGEDEWGVWEKFCFKMVATIARAEPHYPDFVNPPEFGGILILGKHLKPLILQQPLSQPICNEQHVEKTISYIHGPAALINLTYHFFVNQVGEQSTKIVLLENIGETVLFYIWERRPMEALITTSKVQLGPHITNCQAFSLLNGSGSIQSGEKQIFTFHFKSDVPGVFLESWILRIAPRLPSHWTLDPIFFKGVAFSKDHLARLQAKLSRMLYYREMMNGIDEFFVDTLNRAAKASQPTQEVQCAKDYMFSSTAFTFLQKNLAIEPPVYYVPSLYKQLEAFAIVVKAWKPLPLVKSKYVLSTNNRDPSLKANPKEATPLDISSNLKEELPWTWDGSFSIIIAGIEESTMSEKIKQHFRLELIALKELVQIPPCQTMLLHVAVYKMLHGITNYTEEVMQGMPEDFGRSMAKMLMNDYYEKYEQKRLEKAAKAATKMEENPEAAEAEMMELLLEQINMANPPLNEISLESRIGNQDMLEYCFKWLHILTEMRIFMQIGFNDYEEQIQKEQKHLNELINERISKHIPFIDDTLYWDKFALERAKQGLLEGEKKILEANGKKIVLGSQ